MILSYITIVLVRECYSGEKLPVAPLITLIGVVSVAVYAMGLRLERKAIRRQWQINTSK